MSETAQLKAERYAKQAAMLASASKLVTDSIMLQLYVQAAGILASGVCLIVGLIMLARALAGGA